MWLDAHKDNKGVECEVDITKNTLLRCISTPPSGHLPVFASPYSVHTIGAVQLHQTVRALDRVIYVGESPCYQMVPIDFCGSCQGRGIQHMGFIHLSGSEVQSSGDSASATHVNEVNL